MIVDINARQNIPHGHPSSPGSRWCYGHPSSLKEISTNVSTPRTHTLTRHTRTNERTHDDGVGGRVRALSQSPLARLHTRRGEARSESESESKRGASARVRTRRRNAPRVRARGASILVAVLVNCGRALASFSLLPGDSPCRRSQKVHADSAGGSETWGGGVTRSPPKPVSMSAGWRWSSRTPEVG